MARGKQKWYAFGALRKKASSLVPGIGDIYAKIWGVRIEQVKIVEEDAGEGLF